MTKRVLVTIVVLTRTACLGFEPKMDGVTLEFDGKVLRPTSASVAILEEYQFGSHLLLVNSNELVSVHSDSGVRRWQRKSAPGCEFSWLSAEENIAYLLEAPANKRETRLDRQPRLRRINVDSGEWLQDIPASPDSEIAAVACRSNRLIVLSVARNRDGPGVLNYRVAGFRLPEGREVWTHTFSAATEYGFPGVALLAAKRPNQAVPAIRHLSWIGADVLVCAGPRQDLICLDSEQGKVRWKLARIWEIDRGFIGPSVWSHRVGRFGDGFWFDATKEDPARNKAFDQRWRNEIIGGPIAAKRRESEWLPGPYSIFVAVARGPAEAEPFASYVADCILYELDEMGEPLSLVKLPRTVNGSRAQAMADSVIWACQNNGMVRVEATYEIPSGSPGGPDLLTKVDWYRQFSAAEPTAWLISDKASDPIAFGAKRAFRVLSGGYVKKRDDSEFLFPLATIDYDSGSVSEMLLRVPLTARVPEPTMGVTENEMGVLRTHGPHLLAITRLDVSGDTLAITLGMEKWSAVVRFVVKAGVARGTSGHCRRFPTESLLLRPGADFADGRGQLCRY